MLSAFPSESTHSGARAISSRLWSTASDPSFLKLRRRSPRRITRSKLEWVADERPGLFSWAGASKASRTVGSGTSSAQGASKACSANTDAPSTGTPVPSGPTRDRWNLGAVGLTLELFLTFKAPMRSHQTRRSPVASVPVACPTKSLASPGGQSHYASLGRTQSNPTLHGDEVSVLAKSRNTKHPRSTWDRSLPESLSSLS